LAAFPFTLAEAQPSGPTYDLQPGDSLSAVALRFGTTVEALVDANGISDPALVYAGTTLVIPGFEDFSGELVTRSVELGESLRSLALRYGLPEEALIRLNRLVHPERIYAGQPFVIIDREELPASSAGLRGLIPEPGEGWLESAARVGENPWTLAALNSIGQQPWLLPGDMLYVRAGDSPPTAFPDAISRWEIGPVPAVQGRTERIQVELKTPALVRGRLGDYTLNFLASGENEWISLQGVHAMAEPGLMDLELQLLSAANGEAIFGFRQPFQLVSGEYAFDPVLTVPRDTLDPAYTRPENELLAEVFSRVTMERYWEGEFRFPSSNTEVFASYFGSRRNYNDEGYNSYHTGLDFFGAIGDPIFAAAAGKVALAEELRVRGKTTIIDHGWGVYTAYLHQSEIHVSEGEMVQAGDLIGLVGATGRVTGSHLHWEVRVGGVAVEPLEWVLTPFP
jgi:murein DD-endopeptidase MepM/ murein hydrolase activator NlpD